MHTYSPKESITSMSINLEQWEKMKHKPSLSIDSDIMQSISIQELLAMTSKTMTKIPKNKGRGTLLTISFSTFMQSWIIMGERTKLNHFILPCTKKLHLPTASIVTTLTSSLQDLKNPKTNDEIFVKCNALIMFVNGLM